MKAVLIGFGLIAPKYLEVMKELNCEVSGIITRDYQKGIEKAKKSNIKKVYRSVSDIQPDECDCIIILTSPENNARVLKSVMPLKIPILMEKPVAFGSNKMDEIIQLKNRFNSTVMVAMNRRFYSVFHKGIEYLRNKDKKIDSIVIEAPERFSDINLPIFSDSVRENWIYCNPIHCIDLIRFFAGNITKIETNSIPKKYFFSAIGRGSNDIDFTYVSNWKSPGKWSVTLYSDNTRITYNPLENGKILENSIETNIIPSQEDIKFKPGFYIQMKHFLEHHVMNKDNFTWPSSNLEDHKETLALIEKIHTSKI